MNKRLMTRIFDLAHERGIPVMSHKRAPERPNSWVINVKLEGEWTEINDHTLICSPEMDWLERDVKCT